MRPACSLESLRLRLRAPAPPPPAARSHWQHRRVFSLRIDTNLTPRLVLGVLHIPPHTHTHHTHLTSPRRSPHRGSGAPPSASAWTPQQAQQAPAQTWSRIQEGARTLRAPGGRRRRGRAARPPHPSGCQDLWRALPGGARTRSWRCRWGSRVHVGIPSARGDPKCTWGFHVAAGDCGSPGHRCWERCASRGGGTLRKLRRGHPAVRVPGACLDTGAPCCHAPTTAAPKALAL
jgi:hypothetical protein